MTTDLDLDKQIRRIRKKIRQIEHLETLDRALDVEEWVKVKKKSALKEQLAELLKIVLTSPPEKSGPEENPQTVNTEESQRESNEIVITEAESSEPQIIGNMKRRSTGDEISENEITKKARNDEGTEASPDVELESSEELEISNVRKEENREQESEPRQPSTSKVQISVVSTPKKSKKKRIENSWLSESFLVHSLNDGEDDSADRHEDLILAVDVEENFILTGGRDTRLIAWTFENDTAKALHGFRGHTSSVTCCKLKRLSSSVLLGLSGSLDCSLKLWNVEKGTLIKSVYLYSPIKSLSPVFGPDSSRPWLAVGTEGGGIHICKLSENDGESVFYERPFSDDECSAVSCVDSSETKICLGTKSGDICVMALDKESQKKRPNFKMEVKKNVSSKSVLCVKFLSKKTVVFGDQTSFLKVLNLETESITKIANSSGKYGFTDSLTLLQKGEETFLATSSYDIDNSLGHINVFRVNLEESRPLSYLCSLNDEETSRIMAISTGGSQDEKVFVTVGGELKLWQKISSTLPNEDCVIVRPSKVALLFQEEQNSTEDESATESEVSDDEDQIQRRSSNRNHENETNANGWCIIL